MTTATEIRALRKQLDLGRPDFAQLVGVDFRTVIRWETGAVRPTGAAAAVLTALTTSLANSDHADEIVDFLAKAATIGGLAYLLITLLDSAATPARRSPVPKKRRKRTA